MSDLKEAQARLRREALADAWDEGLTVGFSCGYGDGQQVDMRANPYRTQQEGAE